MRTIEDILEQAKHLSVEDRRALLERLEESLTEAEGLPEAAGVGPYSRTLAASGIGHTDFADVSTDKYQHLGQAYADQRESE